MSEVCPIQSSRWDWLDSCWFRPNSTKVDMGPTGHKLTWA